MVYGIVAEKPSAARAFAKALGGMSGTYDGKQYVIVHAAGHLYEYKDPSEMVPASVSDQYKKWSLDALPWDESLFSWEMDPRGDVGGLLSELKSTLSRCDAIVLAGDHDPSGEGGAITINIIRNLGLMHKRFFRLYMDDESVASMQKGFKNMVSIPDLLHHDEYLMYLYRSRWDFLSMQFTRICKCLTGKLLRQGRLKSYMIMLVGEQLKAIAAYKKVPYYQWRFKDENGVVYSSKKEPSFPSKDQLMQGYTQSPVVIDKTEQKHKIPSKFMDLSVLSARMESRYGIKPAVTLQTYQKMYEAQVVSYPRTEDKEITPEQFNDLLPKIDAIASVVGVDPRLLTHRTPRSSHVKTGGAHGANRPGMNVPKSLTDLTQYGPGACEIYEMLALNYLATIAEDCLYDKQDGHLSLYPDFTGSATRITSMGWKLVFYDGDDDDGLSADSPLLGTTAAPFIYEGFPPKPAYPTTGWLMNRLDKDNVGTGSTRTSTFAEITDKKSVKGGDISLLHSKRGRLSFTDIGEMSYMLILGTHIGSMDLTNKVWDMMKAAGKGQVNIDVELRDVQRLVREDIQIMQANLPAVQAKFPDADPLTLVPKDKASGLYKGKTIVSFNIEWGGHRFTDDEVQRLLDGDVISFQAVSKMGKPYVAKGSLQQQTYKGYKFWGFKADFGK